jgi:hypothetical protein
MHDAGLRREGRKAPGRRLDAIRMLEPHGQSQPGGDSQHLTAATIIIMIPNLIASIYDMEIGLPWQDHPYVFMFIMTFSTWLSLLATMFFLRRQIF